MNRLAILLLVASCSGPGQTIKAPAVSHERCMPVIERCELTGAKTDCDDALLCVDLVEAAQLLDAQWQHCREMSGVDAAECSGKVSKLAAELASERLKKWTYGGAGIGIGALLVLLLALL